MRPLALLGAGVLLAGLAALLAFPATVAPAWLVAAHAALGLPLGAMWILGAGALTGGRWIRAAGPALRATLPLLPLALAAFVPLLWLPGAVFSWAAAAPETLPEVVRAKLPFLDLPFLRLRFAIYAVLWLGCAAALFLRPGARRPAPPVLIVHALVTTGFMTDWAMALEPKFFSSIHAMLCAASHAVGAMALATLAVAASGAPEGERSDLAKLLLAALLFWAYLAYMQFLIVWSGNLPHEIVWYLHRAEGGWRAVTWGVILGFWLVPSALLAAAPTRRRAGRLRAAAGLVLGGYALETAWRVGADLSLGPPGTALLLAGIAAWGALAAAALPARTGTRAHG